MAVVCFDSSAFVKLVVEETGSDVAARLWDEADVVPARRLAFPEVGAALAAARRATHLARAITMAEAEPVLVAWDVRLRTAAAEAGLVVAPAGF